MGQRGPQPRPGKIHRLHGSYREDRHGGELKVKPSLPDPPDWLDPVALQEWHRIAPQLFKLGVLTELDTALLSMYCVVFSRWVRAEGELLKNKESVPEIDETPNGYRQQSPWLLIANNAIKQMQSLCAEFGLSPATRARIKLIESRPEQKSLLDMLDQFGKSMAGSGDK
jgi:P27 family predicted phage terminase small subunit